MDLKELTMILKHVYVTMQVTDNSNTFRNKSDIKMIEIEGHSDSDMS